jgi:hypothetical protein
MSDRWSGEGGKTPCLLCSQGLSHAIDFVSCSSGPSLTWVTLKKLYGRRDGQRLMLEEQPARTYCVHAGRCGPPPPTPPPPTPRSQALERNPPVVLIAAIPPRSCLWESWATHPISTRATLPLAQGSYSRLKTSRSTSDLALSESWPLQGTRCMSCVTTLSADPWPPQGTRSPLAKALFSEAKKWPPSPERHESWRSALYAMASCRSGVVLR